MLELNLIHFSKMGPWWGIKWHQSRVFHCQWTHNQVFPLYSLRLQFIIPRKYIACLEGKFLCDNASKLHVNECDESTHNFQDYFTGVGTIKLLSQFQLSDGGRWGADIRDRQS